MAREHAFDPVADAVVLGLGQVLRLDGRRGPGVGQGRGPAEEGAGVTIRIPAESDLPSGLQILVGAEAKVILGPVRDEGPHDDVGPTASAQVSTPASLPPRIDVDGQLRVKEDEGLRMSQGRPSIGGILPVVLQVSDLALQLAHESAGGDKGFDRQVMPGTALQPRIGPGPLHEVGQGEGVKGSIDPLKDLGGSLSVGGERQGVGVVDPRRQDAGDANVAEEIRLQRAVSWVVRRSSRILGPREEVGMIAVQRRGGFGRRIPRAPTGSRRRRKGRAAVGAEGRARPASIWLRLDRAGGPVVRLGPFGRRRLVSGDAIVLAVGPERCDGLDGRRPAIRLDVQLGHVLGPLPRHLGHRSPGLAVQPAILLAAASLALDGALGIDGARLAIGAVVDLGHLLGGGIVAVDVLPGIALLAQDRGPIVVLEAADALDGVGFDLWSRRSGHMTHDMCREGSKPCC